MCRPAHGESSPWPRLVKACPMRQCWNAVPAVASLQRNAVCGNLLTLVCATRPALLPRPGLAQPNSTPPHPPRRPASSSGTPTTCAACSTRTSATFPRTLTCPTSRLWTCSAPVGGLACSPLSNGVHALPSSLLTALDTGLVTSDGDLWRKQRNLLSHALRIDILEDTVVRLRNRKRTLPKPSPPPGPSAQRRVLPPPRP